jgi:hypothetical protein
MKLIDMEHMELVFAGEPWLHKLMPCSKQAIPLLERNEKIVSWVRPKGGDVTQHIPAIRYKDKFFTLSLRMQKAIYRCMSPPLPLGLVVVVVVVVILVYADGMAATFVSKRALKMRRSWMGWSSFEFPTFCSRKRFGPSLDLM